MVTLNIPWLNLIHEWIHTRLPNEPWKSTWKGMMEAMIGLNPLPRYEKNPTTKTFDQSFKRHRIAIPGIVMMLELICTRIWSGFDKVLKNEVVRLHFGKHIINVCLDLTPRKSWTSQRGTYFLPKQEFVPPEHSSHQKLAGFVETEESRPPAKRRMVSGKCSRQPSPRVALREPSLTC